MAAERTYDRTWEEIETMLTRAEKKMRKWKNFFEDCRERGDRDGMKDAARNFKALEGDKQTGINSLPVKFGPDKAAKIACWVMTIPQLIVVMLMASWGAIEYAIVVTCLVAGQLFAMRKLLKDPLKLAPWYNATGVLMFVLGMMVCAFGLRNFGAL